MQDFFQHLCFTIVVSGKFDNGPFVIRPPGVWSWSWFLEISIPKAWQDDTFFFRDQVGCFWKINSQFLRFTGFHLGFFALSRNPHLWIYFGVYKNWLLISFNRWITHPNTGISSCSCDFSLQKSSLVLQEPTKHRHGVHSFWKKP